MAERADDDLNRRDFLRLGGAAVAVVELSIQSNAKRARTVDFPDFTRGRWRTNPRLGIVSV